MFLMTNSIAFGKKENKPEKGFCRPIFEIRLQQKDDTGVMTTSQAITECYDVILVGGGMLGLSTAYHLSRLGARLLLLQAADIGGGSSAACAGRAQVAEGKLDPLSLSLVREGITCLETLEDELETSFEFRRSGFLALIDSQKLWDEWTARSRILSAAGISTEMLDQGSLQQAEPHLNIAGYLGAAYALEGQLNPFLFCWAYALGAKRNGATLVHHAPVTDLQWEKNVGVCVEANGQRYTAAKVVVMCGAWTSLVLQLAGVQIPIDYTHAQAFVTVPVPITLNNTIQLANFYNLIHGKDQAIAVGFNQDSHGALIVTEAVQKTLTIHDKSTAWGISGMAADLLQLFPDLATLQVLRSWGIPTPFTPDEEPVIGWIPGRENLFVAAGFMQTITSVPIVSQWMAQMILDEPLPVDLGRYSPARFLRR
jgi:glycine/D-amino acid oxidase-like deaminating enzyme